VARRGEITEQRAIIASRSRQARRIEIQSHIANPAAGRFQPHPLSALRMAADGDPSLVLRALRLSGIFHRRLRRMLEYFQHPRSLS